MDKSRNDECKATMGTDSASDTMDSAAKGKSEVAYKGYVTYENGLHVDGPRQKATISVDNNTNIITVTMDKPASVFVAPGYPIVIEYAPEMEEAEAQPCREAAVPKRGKKTKDIFF